MVNNESLTTVQRSIDKYLMSPQKVALFVDAEDFKQLLMLARSAMAAECVEIILETQDRSPTDEDVATVREHFRFWNRVNAIESEVFDCSHLSHMASV